MAEQRYMDVPDGDLPLLAWCMDCGSIVPRGIGQEIHNTWHDDMDALLG